MPSRSMTDRRRTAGTVTFSSTVSEPGSKPRTSPSCAGLREGAEVSAIGSAGVADVSMGPPPRAAHLRRPAAWPSCPLTRPQVPCHQDASGAVAGKRDGGSVVPGERRPVGVALLEELVAALLGLVGHVGQAGGLAGEELLADQAVVDEVEGVLQHPLGRGALAVDQPTPLQAGGLELGMGNGTVDRAHPYAVLGGVLLAEEEDLARELLADLAGQVRR